MPRCLCIDSSLFLAALSASVLAIVAPAPPSSSETELSSTLKFSASRRTVLPGWRGKAEHTLLASWRLSRAWRTGGVETTYRYLHGAAGVASAFKKATGRGGASFMTALVRELEPVRRLPASFRAPGRVTKGPTYHSWSILKDDVHANPSELLSVGMDRIRISWKRAGTLPSPMGSLGQGW